MEVLTATPSSHPTAKTAVFDERRHALVRAAYGIIAAEGFERLRTRDVAAKVGINVATLHYYFTTKEALIEGVALHLAGQFQTIRAPAASEPSASAADRLHQEFADARFYLDERPEMISVVQELTQRARRDPSVAAIIGPLNQAWRAGIEAMIAAGVAEGVFNADLDPKGASVVVVAALSGLTSFPFDRAEREHVFAAIEQGLRAPVGDVTLAGGESVRLGRARASRPGATGAIAGTMDR